MLVFDSALGFLIAAPVTAIAHRLILQIALTALITDRAIERVVDQHKFHDALTGFLDHRRICFDDHALTCWHGTGCNRFWRTFHLDKAHAAVAGNREPFVIAEPRHFFAGSLTSLKHGRPVFDLDLYAIYSEFDH